jgi:cobalt-zinc-cadmium efflux system outer membrane protein
MLKTKRMDISIYQAKALQAAFYPNPEIGLDLENIFGSESYRGFSGSENTIYLVQDFVLSDRLTARRDVELLNSALATSELQQEQILVITEIRRIFVQINLLQHKNKLNKKLLKVSRDFQENLNRRIEAGKVSPAEASRASLISTALEIKIESTEMKLQSEIQKLKSVMGNPNISFSNVEKSCRLEFLIPELHELKKMISNSPTLAQFEIDLKRAENEIKVEEAKSLPDLSISLGYRRIAETNNSVFLMGASIPINIFNNNSGNIQRRKIQAEQTKFRYQGLRNNHETELIMLFNNIKNLKNMISKLNDESLPEARKAFEIINKGNLLGRFTVLDVLDSQRSLYELESQFVNAVAEYNMNIIDLEALTLSKFNFKIKGF